MNDATLLADWVRAIRELARRAGDHQVLEALETEAGAFRRDGIHVVFAGGANSGKSTRINALLGRNLLPVSSLRSTVGVSVHHGDDSAIGNTEYVAPNEWLAAAGICILERPPLDAGDADLDAVIRATLRGADAVVLIIDALMPVTRVDAALLAECVRRALPVIITLSKFDHLSADERTSVIEYVQRYVAGAGLEVPLIVTDATHGIEDLRAAIDAVVASTDFAQVRRRQASDALLDLASALELTIHGGLNAQTVTDGERAEELRRKEQRLEAQTLAWMQIEQRLSVRRQKVDEQVREYLATNRASALDSLAFELERSSDVHQWWTHDLPHRLQREIRSVSSQVSNSISRQVAGDVRWLHEELHRQFKFPLAAPLGDPAMDVEEVVVTPSSVALVNMQKFRVVSRIGTAATVVLAGIALAHTGVAGATIAISSLAGLAADQIAQRIAAKDRSGVRTELDRVLQRAWLDLAAQVSAKLKSGYDDLVTGLKKEQARWRESQMQALRATTPASAAIDWPGLLEQMQTLATAIATKGDAS